jgi:hypothetical protein
VEWSEDATVADLLDASVAISRGEALSADEVVRVLLILWPMHVVAGVALAAPIVFLGRKRAHWRVWELSLLVLPFTTWWLLIASPLSDNFKSLANLGIEPLLVALVVPVATLLRVAVGASVSQGLFAAVLILASCAAAAGIFALVPGLPE